MRKIDLTSYEVTGVGIGDGEKPTNVSVVDNLEMLLFGTEGLNGPVLLERAALVDKIKAAGDEILLEDADYKKIEDLLKSSNIFSRTFVEFVRRVSDAPDVEVGEVK